MIKVFISNRYKIILILIILFSIFLRFFQLGVNPPSLTWDEASLGYNAYSILRTGADEYGNKLPLSIRSFDDYKPPGYVYLTIPSVYFFGLNEFSVRLPSAIAGVLSVFIVYFLVKEIFYKLERKQGEQLALIAAFFAGVSPWSLQFSRAAFEGNLGLFFFFLGFLFFVKSLRNSKWFILGSISLALSIYCYHSFRIVAPVFFLFFLILFWKEVRRRGRDYIIGTFLIGMLVLPVLSSFIFQSEGAGSRLSMVSSISSPDILSHSIKELDYDISQNDMLGNLLHNRRIIYLFSFIKGYFDHWNFDFLFLHGDGGRQHHAVEVGMRYLWEAPFLLAGIYFLIRKRTRHSILLGLVFLIAPLPSAVTTGTPHPVRAIAMEIPISIFVALGIFHLFFEKKELIRRIFLLIFSGIFIFNFIYYVHQYYVHTPVEYGDFWQYGYKEVFSFVKPLEDNYDKILVTYKYDQPYVYYLFYNMIDPAWYQENWDYSGDGQVERMRRVIGRYEFKNINLAEEKKVQNSLIVGSASEIPEDTKGIIKTIYFPDGSVAFRIIKT